MADQPREPPAGRRESEALPPRSKARCRSLPQICHPETIDAEADLAGRQWVISVLKRLRSMLANRPHAVAALTKIFPNEIERLLLKASGGNPAANTPTSTSPRATGSSSMSARRRRGRRHAHMGQQRVFDRRE